jgi:hypothetical protein
MFGIDDSARSRRQDCKSATSISGLAGCCLLSAVLCTPYSSATELRPRPRALLRTCLRHAHDGANSRSLSPSSNQKGVGRGAHAAYRHERRHSIGYLQALVCLRAAPSCWCISSLARGLSYLLQISTSIQTCRELGEPIQPISGRCSENCHTASPASLEEAFVCYPIRPPAWGSLTSSMRRQRGRCLSLWPSS